MIALFDTKQDGFSMTPGMSAEILSTMLRLYPNRGVAHLDLLKFSGNSSIKFMNVVMNLIETEKIILLQNSSDEKCKFNIKVRLSKNDKLKNDLTSLTNGSIIIF